MKPRIRSTVLILSLLVVSFVASATTSLSFNGGGYWLDMEIGRLDRPVVASLRLHTQDDREGVVLRDHFKVSRFDVDSQDLVIIYKGGDPRIKPFTLVVRGEKATFQIDGRKIESDFSWFM